MSFSITTGRRRGKIVSYSTSRDIFSNGLTRVFSPNYRENILVGPKKNYLGPSKISPIFHLNQTTQKTIFSCSFYILLVFTSTKQIIEKKKKGGIPMKLRDLA